MQQFEVPNFDIHEDRSVTMAINSKKNSDLRNAEDSPQDKENENKFTMPVAVPQQNVSFWVLKYNIV